MSDSALPGNNSQLQTPPLAEDKHVSLEGLHGTVAVPHEQAGFWEQWRAFVGPAVLISVGYMDPGNWGTDLQGGAQYKYGLLVGGRGRQPDGDLHAGHCRAPRRGDRQGPGAVLPRLVSRLDALAQLADERNGHRRLRPGGGSGQRRGHQPAVSHPAAVGRHHHRPRRASAAGFAALWHAQDRGRGAGAGGDHRDLLLHRDLRSAADAAQFPRNGTRPGRAPLPRKRACCMWPSASSAPP